MDSLTRLFADFFDARIIRILVRSVRVFIRTREGKILKTRIRRFRRKFRRLSKCTVKSELDIIFRSVLIV